MADLACQELVELVTDYLEGVLPRRTRRRVERHLAACDGCDRYVEQMRRTLDLLGTVSVDALEQVEMDVLVEAFRDFHR